MKIGILYLMYLIIGLSFLLGWAFLINMRLDKQLQICQNQPIQTETIYITSEPEIIKVIVPVDEFNFVDYKAK